MDLLQEVRRASLASGPPAWVIAIQPLDARLGPAFAAGREIRQNARGTPTKWMLTFIVFQRTEPPIDETISMARRWRFGG